MGKRKLSYGSILVILSLFLIATTAQSALITQTKVFGPNIPTILDTFVVNEFNDLGGTLTLQSIQVLFSLNITGGTFILDNDSLEPAVGTFNFGATGTIDSTEVTLEKDGGFDVVAELEAAHAGGVINLDSNVGDGAGDFDPSPTDGMSYTGGTENDSDSGFIRTQYFNEYIGTGTYDIFIDIRQWADFNATGGIESSQTPVTASGDVIVKYIYTNAIPEPGTLFLLGGGLLGLAVLGRKKLLRTRK